MPNFMLPQSFQLAPPPSMSPAIRPNPVQFQLMAASVDENSPRLSVDAAQLLADLPPRVARMETHIEYIRLDIAELKGGMKELRTELKSDVAGLRTDFRWLLGIMLGGFGGLLGVMAKGFHLIG